MYKYYCLVFSLLMLVSCVRKKHSVNAVTPGTNRKVSAKKKDQVPGGFVAADTTVRPFADTGYELNLHTFNNERLNTEYNTLLTLHYNINGKGDLLFRDSITCFNAFPDVQMKDMNNDGVDDIMITYDMSGGHSNMMYHLYLCDAINHRVIRVKNFESVYNPELIKKGNIIMSKVLSGTDYYTFHRINSKNKLINLGYGFEVSSEPEDSTTESENFDSAISQILKENKH